MGGAHVYRTLDGVVWDVVVGDDPGALRKGGFGVGANDPQNTSVFASAVFAGRLYVGIKHQGGAGGPAEVWRTANGLTWEQTGGDGFGDLANEGIDAMAVHAGRLYAGTINDANGAELWSTADGTTWSRDAAGGFGAPADNRRVRSMVSTGPRLALGMGNGNSSNDDSRGQILLVSTSLPALSAAGVAIALVLLLVAGSAALGQPRPPSRTSPSAESRRPAARGGSPA